MRAEWAPDGEPILMHLSNFRPVKRVTDVIEIFALVREKIRAKLVLIGDGPDRGAAEYLVRKKKLGRDVHFLGKQDRVYQLLAAGGLVPVAVGHGIVWPCGARGHGLRSSGGGHERGRHCRKWSSTELTDIFLRRGKWKSEQDMPWKFCRARIAGGKWDTRARVNAKKKYCANDVIPMYEAYYRQVIGALAETHA